MQSRHLRLVFVERGPSFIERVEEVVEAVFEEELEGGKGALQVKAFRP